MLGKIRSDYYRAGIVDVGERKVGSDYAPIVLTAARQTRSAYYRSQILTRYLQNSNPDNAALVDVIKLAGELGSDYYRSEVLQQVATAIDSKERHVTRTSLLPSRLGHDITVSGRSRRSSERRADPGHVFRQAC